MTECRDLMGPESGEVVVQTLACAEPGGRWSPSTLELLGDASALARRWAGRVGTWFLTAPGAVAPDLSELAAHGCDVVWQLSSERFAGWCSEAAAAALARYLSPACRVVLLPAGARGEEVAALLAERLETTYWLQRSQSQLAIRTLLDGHG